MSRYLRNLGTLLLVNVLTAIVVFAYFATIDRQTFEANKAFWRTDVEADWITYTWVLAVIILAELVLAWYYSHSLQRHEARLHTGTNATDLPASIRYRAASYPLIITLIALLGWILAGWYYARGGLSLVAPYGLLPWPTVEIVLRTAIGLVMLTSLTAYSLVAFLIDDTARRPRPRLRLIIANGAAWLLAAALFYRGDMMLPTSETFWRTLIGLGMMGGLTAATITFLVVDAAWRYSLPHFFPDGDIAHLHTPRITVGARLIVTTLLTGILPLLVLGTAVVAGAQNLDLIIIFVALFGIGGTIILSLLSARSLLQPLNDLIATLDTARQSPDSGYILSRLSNDELGDLTTYVRRQIEANNQLLAENIRLESALSIQNLEQQVAERTAELAHAREEAEAARRLAEQANESKSAFLAMMSHEIRTPMNAIIGMTSLLLNTTLNTDQVDFAQTIRTSGESLLVIINDILDFSKIEANRMELEIQPMDLRTCIERALDLLVTRAADKGLDLAYELADGTPAAIMGDENRLRQILINLLNNAIKFTNVGAVTVQVDSRPLTNTDGETGYELHFAVTDTGIGIPADRMDRLFKAFSQVDASTTRRYGGTGLGLIISQRLCLLMGGQMWVESSVGLGSTFHFTIHTRAADGATDADLYQEQQQLAGKRLLVVDDYDFHRHIVRHYAQTWGMQIRDTASSAEALDWLQQGESFDFALLDMHLPEMDAMTLATRIQAYGGANAPTCILLTAPGGRITLDNADYAQQDRVAFLSRPIKPAALLQVLTTVSSGERVAPLPTPPAAQPAFDAQMGQRHPLRILLAEDNPTNQKLALYFLQQLGYQADVAPNGVAALAALHQQTYDVVLLDVHMPEMDGLEVARRVVTEWSAAQRPRLVAMTASAMADDRAICLQAGMDDYISKPIRLPALVEALERVASQTAATAPATEIPMATSPSADEDVLPADALQRMLKDIGGDMAFLQQLIVGFQADASRLLTDLHEGWQARDMLRVERAAHTLKSNAREFNATSVAALCQELELQCHNGIFDAVSERITQIEELYMRLQAELDSALTRLQPDLTLHLG